MSKVLKPRYSTKAKKINMPVGTVGQFFASQFEIESLNCAYNLHFKYMYCA